MSKPSADWLNTSTCNVFSDTAPRERDDLVVMTKRARLRPQKIIESARNPPNSATDVVTQKKVPLRGALAPAVRTLKF
ncbi:hypothetical protein Y032_0009g714 [Ancylostoma ceylanicum]|uniref:Uncharacterized protein n=1 Tax=Ancylostoma ceylanicum TaxID=53326 RepID=A0A016VJ11_9BILA|nr:hypothetical protein Y032_0009g714 [Ancylostoma ceylanicum]